jgi:CBS domain containing-hemolysin-like protein
MLVDAGIAISEFNDHLSLSLDDEEFDTLGGYMFGVFERVPAVGESIEVNGWRLATEELEGRRITQVRVTPIVPLD